MNTDFFVAVSSLLLPRTSTHSASTHGISTRGAGTRGRADHQQGSVGGVRVTLGFPTMRGARPGPPRVQGSASLCDHARSEGRG